MAHVHTFGVMAPEAAGIIQYVLSQIPNCGLRSDIAQSRSYLVLCHGVSYRICYL